MLFPFALFLISRPESSRRIAVPAVAAETLKNRTIARIRALIQALRSRSPATSELDQLRDLLDSVALTEPAAGLAALHLRLALLLLQRMNQPEKGLQELRLAAVLVAPVVGPLPRELRRWEPEGPRRAGLRPTAPAAALRARGGD